ncbi:MAG: LamG domain-containing protein, partial [Candidatus Thorarchaeota archaeon]
MAVLVQRDFSGGLINAGDPQLIARNMLQDCAGCDISQPGMVTPKKGWAKINSSEMENVVSDMFFHNIFTTKGMILRADNELYDMDLDGNIKLIEYGTARATHAFCQFGDWIIIVNGTANRKYKQTGPLVHFHIGLTHRWEEDHAGTTYAYALCFRQVYESGIISYSACYDWEKGQIEGTGGEGGGVDLYAAAYTSSCYLDGQGYVATDLPAAGADSTLKLLLNMDGADGHKTFTDGGTTGHTVEPQADAQGDTSEKKFGTASCLLDGTGDYLKIADHADWNFGTGRFTIGGWFYYAGGVGDDLFGQKGDATNYFYLQYNSATASLTLTVVVAGVSLFVADPLVATNVSLAPGTWYLIELVRGWGDDDDAFAITVNGVEKGTASPGAITWPDLGDEFRVGWGSGVAGLYWNGRIDGFYVYKGKALHTAAFTPPTSPIDPAISELEYRPWDYCMQLGIDAPDCSGMGVAETNNGAGQIANGAYIYRITYVNSDGFESNGDSDKQSVTIAAGPSDVALTAIPLSADPQVIKRKIWRTQVGGNLWQLVATLSDNHTTTYTDTTTDANLGAFMHEDVHDVPTAAIDCAEHLAQLFLLQSPNRVWWCKAFNEWEYFPSDNYEPFGSPPTAAIGQK